ncbi:MAG: type I DNA topoisomerase, partial [Thermoanaerobaculia bacterium]|nr:type I DNA topoisomerase [Thermoanaerobaculia bacterium]
VQSVALRLIVDREEERQAFVSSEYWDVAATLGGDETSFPATLTAVGAQRLASSRDFDSTTGVFSGAAKLRILDQEGAEKIAAQSLTATPWRVGKVDRKSKRQRPQPPFITSTLQQAASSRLRMSPKQTMSFAQRLYEGIDLGGGERQGLITYMRTDSFSLSDKAIEDAGTWITAQFGDDYYAGPRRYKTKSKGAQEAHEAIRPTEMGRSPDQVASRLQKEELALYRLIWERAVASQMADALLDNTSADLIATFDGVDHTYRATGSILRFPGYLQVAGTSREDSHLPPLEEGQLLGRTAGDSSPTRPEVDILSTEAQGHQTKPPARYTEATLVKKLEEEGIGRPSTYTPTISTIQDRDYVLKKGGYLIPTYLGIAVINVLRRHFEQYVDLRFTARMEESLDDIAEGKQDWVQFLADFYRGEDSSKLGLAQLIDEQLPLIEFPAIPVGKDPETGQEILVRIGRNYVYVQRGEGDEGERATLPVDLLIDELTPGKAAEILSQRARADAPIGADPESSEPIYLKSGPYGPYVQLGDGDKKEKPKRVSLPKGTSMESVDLPMALRLLSLPRVVGVDPDSGSEVTAGLGRFGPYVSRDRKYQSLDAFEEIFTVTLEEALKRLAVKGKRVIKELGPHPESGEEVRVLSGRYGPYVTDGTTNASLPKDLEPTTIEMARAVELLAERAKLPKKPRRGRAGAKKAAPKKAASKKTGTKKAAPKKAAAKKTAAKKTAKKPAAKKTPAT